MSNKESKGKKCPPKPIPLLKDTKQVTLIVTYDMTWTQTLTLKLLKGGLRLEILWTL